VINRPLENLAIDLEEGGPSWFGLLQHSPDRPLQWVTFNRALDSREEAKLPLRTALTRFLRKPYVELSARQRKCLPVKFHPTAPTRAV
jgi:hypothetical protein